MLFSQSLLLIHCADFHFVASEGVFDQIPTVRAQVRLSFDLQPLPRNIHSVRATCHSGHTCATWQNPREIICVYIDMLPDAFVCQSKSESRTNRRVSAEISQSRSHGHSPSRCGWSAAPLSSSPRTTARHTSPGASWETAACCLFLVHSPLVYSTLGKRETERQC